MGMAWVAAIACSATVAATCGPHPTVPGAIHHAIDTRVVYDQTNGGRIDNAAAVESFEPQEASIGPKRAWVRVWVGTRETRDDDGRAYTNHFKTAYEFWLKKVGEGWAVTREKFDGYPPGYAPG